MKVISLRNLPLEKLSLYVRYAIIALTVLVFLAFYLVGFQMPYMENPHFNAPLLTDVLMVFMWVVLAVGVTVWAVVAAWRCRDKGGNVEHGVPVARIAYGTAGFTLVLMVLSFLLGSSKAILINTHSYRETFWLKTADMFVVSSVVLMLVALGVILYGYVRQLLTSK